MVVIVHLTPNYFQGCLPLRYFYSEFGTSYGSALVENSPATNWQHCKIMLVRVKSSNFLGQKCPNR